jgi:hypothetical protein
MNITKLETVDVDQRVVDRIGDFGTVWIRGIGSTCRNALIVG